MLKFALKNMGVKKVQIILIIISIIISASVGILAFNISSQVSDGLKNNAGYYSCVIGPTGSKTQLAMNSIYFTEDHLGTIPYSVVEELERNPSVTRAIPLAMGELYNGFKVVGTSSALLIDKELDTGALFDDSKTMQAVIGYRVAAEQGLQLGDRIYTSHAVGGENAHKDKGGIEVVGILKETYSTFDTTVFINFKTIWEMHEHGEEEHEVDTHNEINTSEEEYGHEAPNENEHNGEHEAEGENAHVHGMICSVLVNTKNLGQAMSLIEEYRNKNASDSEGNLYPLQAIDPSETIRVVIDDADNTKYIVFVLCAVILIMNIIVISIITLLNMYHSSKEISLMRLIGISMKKINLLYIIQNSIIGLFSTVLAFGVSRICLLLMGDYVASMGVVLNVGAVYVTEFLILLGIFLISVIPTIICTFVMAKRDSLAE